MNNLLALTFTLAIKAVKGWLSLQGIEVNPLVEEWVSHFFHGGGKDKSLPEEVIEETKQAIIGSLEVLWYCPSWHTGVSRVGSSEWHHFFTSLSGVIGTFNYKLEGEGEGLRVKCWDLWDFNTGNNNPVDPHTGEDINFSGVLSINIESKVLRNTIKNLAKMLGILLEEDDCTLSVLESNLSILNKERAFYTRWELYIPFEELSLPEELTIEDINWELGGLPIVWVQEQALLQAVRSLNLCCLSDEEDNYVGIKIPFGEGSLPLTWDSINYLRTLPSEDLKFNSRKRRIKH